MKIGWQELVVLLVVLIAMTYVARRLRGRRSSRKPNQPDVDVKRLTRKRK